MVDQQDENLIRKDKKTYDDAFTSVLLEQYKMYVQTAENVSSRRVAVSRYLLTLSAALIAIYGTTPVNPRPRLLAAICFSNRSVCFTALVQTYQIT